MQTRHYTTQELDSMVAAIATTMRNLGKPDGILVKRVNLHRPKSGQPIKKLASIVEQEAAHDRQLIIFIHPDDYSYYMLHANFCSENLFVQTKIHRLAFAGFIGVFKSKISVYSTYFVRDVDRLGYAIPENTCLFVYNKASKNYDETYQPPKTPAVTEEPFQGPQVYPS